MRTRHYKQLLLFVVALIVPSLLIAGLGWTVLKQDRENRVEDARNSARERIQKEIRLRLDNLATKVAAGTPAAAVKFVAWVAGDNLVMPWERDPNAEASRLAREDSEFAASLENAEDLEIQDRPDQAAALYRSLIQNSSSDHQRAYARRSLALVLRRSGAQAEATGAYRDLLSLPSSLVDKEGYPFASVAALALAKTAPREVLDRVAREVPAALTLDQAYRWRDVLKAIEKPDAAVSTLLDTLAARIAILEADQRNLQHDADLDALRRDFSDLGVIDSAWRSYHDLLISRATAGDRRLVIAVRTKDILQGLPFTPVHLPPEGGSHELRDPEGERHELPDHELLDAQLLPGLKGTFGPVDTAAVSGLDLRRWLYAPSILLVLCLNLFGGYLLWRDTRREVRLAELRSQFVSSVSHELKTPLTAIRMFGEILQRGSSVDPDTHGECVDTIVNESERLTRLLNNVLDFSRIERGQKEYRMEPTQLSDVVSSAAQTMHYPLAEQGFSLTMDVDEKIPPVQADRDALTQAVLNLLTNAMKYSGQSRGIELRLFPQNGDALIAVSDHGIGIAPMEQRRIFERFYRASVPENQSVAGTGLGLALVDHIAKGHGGSVQVESSPGAGSTFSIRLPMAAGEHA